MVEEQFAKGSSFLHRTAAKIKIVVAIIFISVVAISYSFKVVSAGLLLSCLLFLLSDLKIVPVLKRLLAANTFTLFIWITLPVTYPGTPLAQIGPFAISEQGVVLASLITLKTNAIVLSFIALLSTSTIASIGYALETLRFPKRLCFLLLFSYRYVFVIHQEYLKLARAAQLRCFVPKTNTHTYRTVGYLFGMTLVKSWNRASRIHQAMQLRGFNGKLVSLEQQPVTSTDIYFFVAALIITVCMASLNFI